MTARCVLARAVLLAATAVALAGTAGCRTNPVTGSGELVLISAETELALGHQAHPDVVFMYDGEYIDPELNRYLGTIVMRLHEASHRSELPMDFTMLNTSVVNAFATPGHVYATRGFLARLENEAQFAAVMGHELAHVAAGHSARQLTRGMVTEVLLGVAGSVADDSLVGTLAVGAGRASVVLMGLSYSREQERQADRVGTYYMALAGWDPRQAIAMQRLLAALSSDSHSVLDRYLSTHPEEGNRVGEIEGVIEQEDLRRPRYVQGDGVFADRWQRRLRRLRGVDEAFEPCDRGRKLLADAKAAEALAAAEEAIRARRDQAQFYALKGDALYMLERTDDARRAYEESLDRDARYVPANVGLGRVFFSKAQYADAERQFATAARGFPSSAVAWYGLGASRYHRGDYAGAIPALEKVAPAYPDDPEFHYMLAVCYEETGQRQKAYVSYAQALETGLEGAEAQRARERLRVLQPYAPAAA